MNMIMIWGQLYTFTTESEEGISLGVIIAILVIAFIILFIVVDVTCYYKRRWGVIMCFKQKLCSSSSAGAGGAKDAEKGGDEYVLIQ